MHHMRDPFWSFTRRKAILTQNIQTISFTQISYIKHKSLFIQLTFNQNQFYKINSPKLNFSWVQNQTHAKRKILTTVSSSFFVVSLSQISISSSKLSSLHFTSLSYLSHTSFQPTFQFEQMSVQINLF